MEHAVVPLPSSLRPSTGAPFPLTASTPITGDPSTAAELQRIIDVAASTRPEDAMPDPPAIDLRIEPGGAPESYTLSSMETGVTVTGADAAGLFYGVQTLGQLTTRTDDGAWIIPAVEIADEPRFAYRGFMLDVARHFHSVETVKACIDRASALKLNHLHLHLTDDQGWRIELTRRPLLTERASSSAIGGDAGGFYTQDDYREIVAYAAAHHMTVVPEIDLPGHTHAVSLAYPELSEEPVLSEHVLEVVRTFGGGEPRNGEPYQGLAVGFSSLRIHDEATYAFVDDVLTELAELTPGPYLHIGGDEALGTSAEDYAFFIERVTRIAAATGKTPIAWHEAGAIGERLPHADTADETAVVGQYWGYRVPTDGMDEKTRAFVRAGGQVILSPADAIYLDMKHADDAPLGLTWAGIVPAEQSYDWEPSAIVDGVDEADILGVEAPLWSETIRTLDDIDAMVFPRIAAAAEAGWSPARGTTADRTWESFRARVARLAPLWKANGIAYTAVPGIPWIGETKDETDAGDVRPLSSTAPARQD